MTAERVLVVDDEPGVRVVLCKFFRANGYFVDEATSCVEAEASWRVGRPDVAIVDHNLPGADGIEVLRRLAEFDSTVPVVMLTGHGSIDLAVRAMKEGAEQFLTKPVELPALLLVVRRILDLQRSRKQQAATHSKESREIIDVFLGPSQVIRQLANEASRLLSSESPILIRGETGTGKGVLANWLHRNGPRSMEAFVDLNCAGLTREFLETELFGHEKGAFTGAVAAKPGLLEVAHRGTLFLDEIGDLDATVQPKLLKVLEEQRYRRMGDVHDRRVSVRLIAASHHDLSQLVDEQKFRKDLYYRIATLPLVVPPLRQRREDIPLLANAILRRLVGEVRREASTLSPAALEVLVNYPWPGNIRELRNVLERAVLLSNGAEIGERDLSALTAASPRPHTSDARSLTLEEVERQHIALIVDEEKGHVDTAARRLGIPRSSLYTKLRRYGIATTKV